LREARDALHNSHRCATMR